MVTALACVGGSLVFLLILTAVYAAEDARGQRIFLVKVRESLDTFLFRVMQRLTIVSSFFTHGFMRLLLHYGAHTILKRILGAIRGLEKRVEELVRKNRRVAKDIHAAKVRTHLDAIAEHKEETALSETQKKERRSR